VTVPKCLRVAPFRETGRLFPLRALLGSPPQRYASIFCPSGCTRIIPAPFSSSQGPFSPPTWTLWTLSRARASFSRFQSGAFRPFFILLFPSKLRAFTLEHGRWQHLGPPPWERHHGGNFLLNSYDRASIVWGPCGRFFRGALPSLFLHGRPAAFPPQGRIWIDLSSLPRAVGQAMARSTPPLLKRPKILLFLCLSE